MKYLPEYATNTLGYTLILTIGIIHGANDIHLELKKNELTATKTKSIALLLKYVLVTLLTAIVFYFFSSIALLLFIIFSGYHFGEQHWQRHITSFKKTRSLFFGLYGLMILSLFFFCNTEGSQEVIKHLTGILVPEQVFTISFIITSISFLILALCYLKQKTTDFWMRELFFMIVFALLFTLAPLVWAFAIYFIFWHSIPSLRDQIHFLYNGTSKNHIIAYTKQALVFWIISLIAITLFVIFLKDQVQILTAILVAFLAAITIPHTLLMRKIFKTD